MSWVRAPRWEFLFLNFQKVFYILRLLYMAYLSGMTSSKLVIVALAFFLFTNSTKYGRLRSHG